MEEIKEYSAMSDYKLNMGKSEAMIIGQPLSQTIRSKYNLKWQQNKLRYLGVTICQDFDKLYQHNFDALEGQIKQDLQKWVLIPLTITERIEIIKTNNLPRFLFLFQNLPICILKKNFSQWDKTINTFIWGERKPRIKLKMLKTAKLHRELALPNLINYYYAALIRPVTVWLSNT